MYAVPQRDLLELRAQTEFGISNQTWLGLEEMVYFFQ
jgi:hypothetical protein